MRRTMHAALVALCLTVNAYGQSPENSLVTSVPATPEIAGAALLPQAAVPQAAPPVEIGNGTGCSHCGGGSAGVLTHPLGCERPYSPLGARMSCNEYSPMLWATYPAERAAAIAHLMHHVDHQCDCGHHRSILHRRGNAASCSSGGCHEKAGTAPACDSVVVNRYQIQPSQPQPVVSIQPQPVVATKEKEGSLFGLKLSSWTSKASAGDSNDVKTVPTSPAKATSVSPYLKSEPQLPKSAMLSPVATEPGPLQFAR
jgi:hypothetical protein